jgi:hypothetical protein
MATGVGRMSVRPTAVTGRTEAGAAPDVAVLPQLKTPVGLYPAFSMFAY